MFECTRCGSRYSSYVNFCRTCGNPVAANTQAQSGQQQFNNYPGSQNAYNCSQNQGNYAENRGGNNNRQYSTVQYNNRQAEYENNVRFQSRCGTASVFAKISLIAGISGVIGSVISLIVSILLMVNAGKEEWEELIMFNNADDHATVSLCISIIVFALSVAGVIFGFCSPERKSRIGAKSKYCIVSIAATAIALISVIMSVAGYCAI